MKNGPHFGLKLLIINSQIKSFSTELLDLNETNNVCPCTDFSAAYAYAKEIKMYVQQVIGECC